MRCHCGPPLDLWLSLTHALLRFPSNIQKHATVTPIYVICVTFKWNHNIFLMISICLFFCHPFIHYHVYSFNISSITNHFPWRLAILVSYAVGNDLMIQMLTAVYVVWWEQTGKAAQSEMNYYDSLRKHSTVHGTCSGSSWPPHLPPPQLH